jgi:YggT family protein
MTLFLSFLLSFLQIYLTLLGVRVSLTWFPNINWYGQPFYFLARLTDPYLRLFRGIIPPLIGMDLSAILGFLMLQCIMQIVSSIRLT